MRATPRGLLFVALAAGLGAIAYMGAVGRVWVVAFAAAVLCAWMADLARRELGLVRRRNQSRRR